MYWKFKILETGETAFVTGSSRADATKRLTEIFDEGNFLLMGLTSEALVFFEGSDVY